MRILVALGGNAILGRGQSGIAEQQYRAMSETCSHLAKIIKAGHRMIITHGNGPQVGDIVLAYESARKVIPRMPLDVCGAQSQGMIGYMLQLTLENELRRAGVSASVATLLTRTVVDPADPAFSKPTKPVGPYYTKATRREGWTFVREGDRGYRRVVPSPAPVKVVESETIAKLFGEGVVVVAAGGGGVPVVEGKGGAYRGVEAVVDKDLTAELLARRLGVDLFMILTDVEGVFTRYGSRSQKLLRKLTAVQAKKLLESGELPAGSIGPKVKAAAGFVAATGKRATIARLSAAEEALSGRAGTSFVP